MKTNLKEFTVKEDKAFRLRVESWECISPKGLFAVNFINECFDKDGEVDYSSTYNFFLTKEDMQTLAQGLAQ